MALDHQIHASDQRWALSSTQPQSYGDVKISDNANVHLGNSYVFNKDLFESEKVARNTALLNILHFDGADLKRTQLTLSGPVEKSFAWIKETLFMEWLQTASPLPFWIQGKPASGKSTLMKHLAESKFTKDYLNQRLDGQPPWTIVYFFFDYRAGKATANNVLGMQKLFIAQLGEGIPSIKEWLISDRGPSKTLETSDEDKYLDILVDLVNKSGVRVCAFIDGLDEFEGDLWELCSTLERIRTRTGIRMCLASRPEPAFEHSFGKTGCPSLTMQDHNAATIRTYLQYRIERFQSEHILAQDLFTKSLEDAIVLKAQGVILWAVLVVGEMIKVCHAGPSTVSLFLYLDSAPPELEPLYERILNRTSDRYKAETAFLLLLISDTVKSYGGSESAPVLLCQMLNYFQITYLGGSQMLPCDLSANVYETRIKGLLGNLIDIIIPEPSSWRSKFPQVRLIHKSLSTYLARTRWIEHHVPEAALPLCVKPVWKRVAIEILTSIAEDGPVNQEELRKYHAANTYVPYRDSFDLERLIKSDCNLRPLLARPYQPWTALIFFLVAAFYSLEQQIEGDTSLNLVFPAGASDFALLHRSTCRDCGLLRYWGWFEKSRVEIVHVQGTLNLSLEVCHNHYDRFLNCIDKMLQQSITTVSPDFYDLIVLSLAKSYNEAGAEQILRKFRDLGFYIEPRHICMVPALLRRREIAELIAAGASPGISRELSLVHDRDCPDRKAHVNFGRHWLELNTVDCAIFLQFIRGAGIDLNQTFKSQGGFYSALLTLASPKDKAVTDKALLRFMAAAQSNYSPESSALELARRLREQNDSVSGRGPRLGKSKFLDWCRECYLGFLSWSIEGLEFYENHGRWQATWANSVYTVQYVDGRVLISNTETSASKPTSAKRAKFWKRNRK